MKIEYDSEDWDNDRIVRVGDCAAADEYIDEVLANVAKMVIEQVAIVIILYVAKTLPHYYHL